MNPTLSAFLSKRLLDRKGGHRELVLDAFRDHMRQDQMDRAALDRTMGDRLAKLLNHARRHVPRFVRLLRDAPEITAVNAREILRAIPPMVRSDIQEHPTDFLADNVGDSVDDATGGSTGTPMVFKVDRSTQIAREASLMWADQLAGWRYGERIAMLWGAPKDLSVTQNLRARLRCWIENRRWYNAFNMGDNRMREFHRDMEQFRPHILVAYAGAAFAFARWLDEQKLQPSYPLRAVISSAEVLLPEMRAAMEKTFGRSVFDRYGNREAGAMAAECEKHRGLHVNESDVLVEVDGPDPFRADGPILITSLCNYAMPFIRYETGDLGRLAEGSCTCGRQTLRLAKVVGRQSDMIRTASGKLIHGEFFTHLLYGSPAREFQFVQQSMADYELLVTGDRAAIAAAQAAWKKEILHHVGHDAAVNIRHVDQIPSLPSGKRRFTVSKLRTSS
ncbi:MAG TPA: hypothetical protein PLE77_02420 [Kiritimatiellia bacterium]|nr:hypothetical protein [Kiritimatiellia bacterium]